MIRLSQPGATSISAPVFRAAGFPRRADGGAVLPGGSGGVRCESAPCRLFHLRRARHPSRSERSIFCSDTPLPSISLSICAQPFFTYRSDTSLPSASLSICAQPFFSRSDTSLPSAFLPIRGRPFRLLFWNTATSLQLLFYPLFPRICHTFLQHIRYSQIHLFASLPEDSSTKNGIPNGIRTRVCEVKKFLKYSFATHHRANLTDTCGCVSFHSSPKSGARNVSRRRAVVVS